MNENDLINKLTQNSLWELFLKKDEKKKEKEEEPYIRRTPVTQATPPTLKDALPAIGDVAKVAFAPWMIGVEKLALPMLESLTNKAKILYGAQVAQMTGRVGGWSEGSRPMTLEERKGIDNLVGRETAEIAFYLSGAPQKAISGTLKNISKFIEPKTTQLWNKFWRRVGGEKWTLQDRQVLWNKINTSGAKFDDRELKAITELKKIAEEEGKSLGQLFGMKKPLWLETKHPIFRDISYQKAIVDPFRAAESQYGITPAGKIPPKTYPLTTTTPQPAVGPVPEVSPSVPTFLRPEESMAKAQREVISDMVTRMGLNAPRHYPMTKPAPSIKEPRPLTRPETRVYKPWNQMSLIEKYRYMHAGNEPTMTTDEINNEVDRLLSEKPPTEIEIMYRDVIDMARRLSAEPGTFAVGTGVQPSTPTTAVPGVGEYRPTPQGYGFGVSPAQSTLAVPGLGEIQPPGVMYTDVVSPRQLLHLVGGGYGPAAGMKSVWQLQRELMSKASKELKSLDIKHMRPEYQKPVMDIIRQFDLSKPTDKTVYRLQQMADYIAREPENNIPAEKLDELKRLDKIALREMKLKDVDDIVMAVRHLAHLNKLKNKMIFGRRLREAKEVIYEGIGNMLTSKSIPINPDVISSFDIERPAGALKKFFSTAQYHPETMTMILDGKDGGVITNVIYKGISDGVRESLAYEQQIEDWWTAQHRRLGISVDDLSRMSRAIGGKQVQPRTFELSTGKKLKLSSDEVIALIMHARNLRNLKSLVKGGFRFPYAEHKLHHISLKELKEVLSMATPQEIGVAKAGHEFFDTIQKNAINRVTVDLNGFELAREPYYWHKEVSSLDRKVDYTKPRKNFMHATLEGMGMLKERTGASTPIVLRGFYDELFRSIHKSSAYVGLAKPLRNAKMMMNDGKFKQMVIANYGKHYWKALDKYLRYMEDSSHDVTAVDELGMKAMQRIDFYTLGINPGVMMKQLPSWFMALTEMPGKYLFRVLKTPITGRVVSEMRKYSPFLRDRIDGTGFSRETYDIGQVGAVRRFFTGKTPGHAVLLKGVRFFDLQVVGRIWNAAKLEIAETMPGLRGDDYWEAVARRTEEVVRKTQPAPRPEDRPEIARDPHIAAKLLSKYTTQRNQNLNQLRRLFVKYNSSEKTPADKAKLVRDMLIITLISSATITAQGELVNRALRRKGSSWLSMALRTFGNTLSYSYLVGDIFNVMVSNIERGEYAGYDYDNLLTALLNDIAGIGSGTVTTLTQMFTKEEYKSGKNKGEKKFVNSAKRLGIKVADVVGKIKGIPLGTIRRYAEGVYRWVDNEEEKKQQKKNTADDNRKRVFGY